MVKQCVSVRNAASPSCFYAKVRYATGEMMSTSKIFGKVFCVGVGPGDPDLITVKGQRLLRDADIIAFPGDSSIAYQIALEAVPEIREKAQLSLHMPMTADPIQLDSAHRSAVISLETVLKDGSTVAVVTLGDPAFYSSQT